MPDVHEEALYAFELCEQFAERLQVPVDYVWSEFADPSILTPDEVIAILSRY